VRHFDPMSVGGRYLIAGATVGIIAACGLALAFWVRSVTHDSASRDAAPSTVAPLPAASARATLGKEAAELHELLDAGVPTALGKHPNARPHRRDELFTLRSTMALPRLRNSPLSDGHDERTDGFVRSLVDVSAGRKPFELALGRSSNFKSQIESIFAAWKVPEALIAIVFVESAFDLLSEDGDRVGLWGLKPIDATTYGLFLSNKYDERLAVSLCSEVAAHYLKDLHDRFGSREITLAAFGAGYPRGLEIAASIAGRPYWTAAAAGVVPEDVQTYVGEVIAVSLVLTNADAFQLAMPSTETVGTSDLEVPSGTPFATISQATNVPIARLRELNPEFLTDVIPATEFPMYVHVPSDSLARARELLMPLLTARTGAGLVQAHKEDAGSLQSADRPLGVNEKTFYRVREGDTVASVATHFGVTADRLASDNALSLSSTLRPGMLLVVRKLDSDTMRPDASR